MKLLNIAPYLINAHIYWLDDSGGTPHIMLKNSEKSMFPPAFQNEVAVLFNISETAVQNFSLDDNGVSFVARFSGREFEVYAPLDCIISIQSKDGTINIPIGTQETVKDLVDQTEIDAPFKEPIKFEVINGDSQGDGVPSGKLTLVD